MRGGYAYQSPGHLLPLFLSNKVKSSIVLYALEEDIPYTEIEEPCGGFVLFSTKYPRNNPIIEIMGTTLDCLGPIGKPHRTTWMYFLGVLGEEL